jgi:hypothetical protein
MKEHFAMHEVETAYVSVTHMLFSFKGASRFIIQGSPALAQTSCGNVNVPDVWNTGSDVELCTWVKIFLRSVHGRLNSLIFVSEQPNKTSQKI